VKSGMRRRSRFFVLKMMWLCMQTNDWGMIDLESYCRPFGTHCRPVGALLVVAAFFQGLTPLAND
jgi:hypothetical protein